MLHKTCAAMLFACGCLLWLGAVDGEAFAITCTPQPAVKPATCNPAHEAEPGSTGDVDLSCQVQNGQCVPRIASYCGSIEGYGTAMGGICEFRIVDSNPRECIKDDHATVIKLKYYRTACQVYEGTCQCMYLITTTPHVHVDICDCKTVTP